MVARGSSPISETTIMTKDWMRASASVRRCAYMVFCTDVCLGNRDRQRRPRSEAFSTAGGSPSTASWNKAQQHECGSLTQVALLIYDWHRTEAHTGEFLR
jgi:hypothetical protein